MIWDYGGSLAGKVNQEPEQTWWNLLDFLLPVTFPEDIYSCVSKDAFDLSEGLLVLYIG